jgi:hypothetical protein
VLDRLMARENRTMLVSLQHGLLLAACNGQPSPLMF